ncbi:polysaccharide lyase family 7 protein [Pseudocolwellia sp. HL-MZ19]|uniref:polysaccharide lyase family 7 protein n=1 Tax=unclassified Pseudocolwellia TaxID=2848178 RepID=UPI003CFBBC4E
MLSPIKVLLVLCIAMGIVQHNIAQAQEIKNSRSEVIKLDPSLSPAENFNLKQWSLSLPVDTNKDGIADNVPENYVSQGLTIKPLFYTAEDGGMVFYAPAEGPKTSENTKYTRTELREMLREGDNSIKTKGISKNNWVFSTSRSAIRRKSGGIDGTLDATLSVNHVTTTGDIKKLGRVVIGQIHATKDEPLRIYYRKLPTNTHGAIYIAHEPLESDEQWYELIGSRKSDTTNNEDGIRLDEVFSYRVEVDGDSLKVTIIRDGKPDVVQEVDMSNSGYERNDQYMYFKAGVYNQNNTADENDYVQATFYQLENSHK